MPDIRAFLLSTFRNLFRMQVYHLFGWFWLMNFIIAFGQCVLAGAFASWYWAWDKKTVCIISLLPSQCVCPLCATTHGIFGFFQCVVTRTFVADPTSTLITGRREGLAQSEVKMISRSAIGL